MRNPPPPGQQQSRFARHRAIETTRDTRIQIQTGLLFKVPHQEIREILSVTESQIQYARKNPITPQKKKVDGSLLLIHRNVNKLNNGFKLAGHDGVFHGKKFQDFYQVLKR